MSAHARAKAEEKIGLSLKIAGISQEQLSLEPIAPLAKLDDTAVVSEPSSRVEESPALSESMRLRSALMTALKEHIVRTHLSQSQAAKVFGVTQPRISDLTRGKADVFGLDALVNMAAMAGLRVEMNVHEAMS